MDLFSKNFVPLEKKYITPNLLYGLYERFQTKFHKKKCTMDSIIIIFNNPRPADNKKLIPIIFKFTNSSYVYYMHSIYL